jgi:hypothetical protein
MRHMISGMVAAVAVMAAAPAMACGYGSCSPCGTGYFSPCAAPVYSAPVVSYGYTNYGCSAGCGWVTERLPDPVQQYYYVNQGPTYTGPGNWAPEPTYQEGPRYGRSYYGYRHHYRPWRPRVSYRYGYAPRYHYGHRVLRRYY